MPLLKVGAEGDKLTADDVDEGQADGGAKSSVQLLDDLLLVLDHKEGASCCEAHNGRPDDDQEQGLQVSKNACIAALMPHAHVTSNKIGNAGNNLHQKLQRAATCFCWLLNFKPDQ